MADRSLVYRLKADIAHYAAGMRAAKGIMSDLADQATRADRESEKFRRGLDSFGGAAGRFGLVAAAGLGAAVTTAANFDQAMSRVNAATHESETNMERLREAAIKAGADTAFSASEAAAGIENLAKAGVETSDVLSGGLQGALDLAAAGTMEVSDAAEAAAGAMAQFGLDGSQVPHIADLLAAGAGKAQGEVSDLVQALKQGGTVAAQTGLSLEETTAGLAALAEQSLLGSDAGTSFKQFLASLTPNSEKAGKAMESLGFSAFDAQGKFVGLEEVAGRMREAFGGLTDEQRMARMETIFGSDAVRAASILYDNGAEGIANWTEKVNDSGYAADTASRNLDNLKGDLETFKGSLETALIGTGDGAQGPLRSLVQGLTDVVNAYNDLPDSAQTAVGGLLAAGSLLGGSIWAGSKIVRTISDTREALENLGGAGRIASKGLRGLGGATLVVGGIVALDSAIDGLLSSMRDTPPATQRFTEELLKLNDQGGNLDSLGKGFEDLGKSLDFVEEWGDLDGGMFDWIPNVTGLIPGWENDAEEAARLREEFEALDAALVNIVQVGTPEQAAAALDSLTESAGLSEGQVKTLTALLPDYQEALAGVANEAALTPETEDASTAAVTRNTRAVEKNVETLKDRMDAMREERDMRLAALDAEIAYQQSLDDANAAIKENGENWDLTTEKGRDNRQALLDVAEGWNGLSNKMQNAPGAFKKAKDEFIDLAERMGASETQARRLAREVLNLPSKKVKVQLEADRAMELARQLKDHLDDIKSKTIKVTAVYGSSGSLYDTHVRGDGGTGGRYATGGYISGPGTGTSDSIPAWLSNGEYVINARATARHRALLEAINSNRYASGGYVGSASFSATPMSDRDVMRIVQALSAARPVYGDVNVYGDRSFERQALHRAMGGS